MAVCTTCNTEVSGNVNFCTNCGARMDAGVAVPAAAVASVPTVVSPVPTASAEGATPTAATPAVSPEGAAPPAASNIDEDKLMAILGYIIFFIPLLTGHHKKSPFVRFHVNQGTILWIMSLAWNVGLVVLRLALVPLKLGSIVALIGSLGGLVSLGIFVLAILGIIGAVQGETKPLPIIGGYKIIK